MKLQTILNRLQKLHPKEIDLSLDRVKNLCKKLGDPQKKLKYISVVGTNGKYSTIQAVRSILKTANIDCNIYTSPHIQKINERFIFNDKEISDDNLSKLLIEVENVNNGEQITYFEILTAAYFYHASKFKDKINIIESGLFHRFDATNIIDNNLSSIVTSIGLDHLDWLPKNEQNIEKIVLIPDGAGEFTRKMGMLVYKDKLGFGMRSWGYAAVVNDGTVESWYEEPGFCDNSDDDPYGVSSPEKVLEQL